MLYLGLAGLSLSSVACEGVETMGGYIGWTNTILVLYAAPRYKVFHVFKLVINFNALTSFYSDTISD